MQIPDLRFFLPTSNRRAGKRGTGWLSRNTCATHVRIKYRGKTSFCGGAFEAIAFMYVCFDSYMYVMYMQCRYSRDGFVRFAR